MRHTMNSIGDPSVLYLPLDYLKWDLSEELEGVVVKRSDVATVVGVEENMLLEASIVMGNDYTAPFLVERKFRKSTNFHNDAESSGRISTVEVLQHLSLLGESYKIQSDHELRHLSIEFTRDSYQFRNINHYPSDIDIKELL